MTFDGGAEVDVRFSYVPSGQPYFIATHFSYFPQVAVGKRLSVLNPPP